MEAEREDLTGTVRSEPETRPNKLARVLAATIVSTVVAAVVTKLLGRKVGLVAMFVTASAHEVLDAPLARLLGDLGLRTSDSLPHT